ncbi:MAG: ribonuclease R [Prevotellaceae bacterium]|jgi:ribonuclease R|nr:ribonuclease R [Prevotellaceae bacterium]
MSKKKKKNAAPEDMATAIRRWAAKQTKAFALRQLAHELNIPLPEREQAHAVLLQMVDEQALEMQGAKFRPRSGTPAKNASQEAVGTLMMAGQGYGFAKVEGLEEDVFIPQRALRGALHGDTVRIRYTLNRARKNKRMEGAVEALVERSKRPYIGILQKIQHRAYVITENRNMPYDIKIQPHELHGAENGQKVAALVLDWDAKNREPLGRIVDVLGMPGENDTEMHAILAEFNLPYRFSEAIEREAAQIPTAISAADVASRRDFRGTVTFTIDPADAKDYDDALSFRPLENGHCEVGVHIADVTHYVRPGTLLEKEAAERATSVYLVDRTVSMLPEKLSNNLCSLRPNEDKLCFSAVFELNAEAQIIHTWFGRTIIRSIQRFDYDEAQAVIESGNGPLAAELATLHRLAQALRKMRFENGSILFERPEPKVEVDENGKPLRVYFKEPKESNFLIEEFMLLANRSVAEAVGNRRPAPAFVYRVHDEPTPEKLKTFRDFIHHFGYSLRQTQSPVEAARELNKLLGKVKNTPEGTIIEGMALRSMARAQYTTDNVGHFGLAFAHYTHFTSPIRRYPDMLVHRLLAHYLAGGEFLPKDHYEHLCKYCSAREQVATDAERASIKYKMVEFMLDKEGQEFAGTVSGVTEWGLYVEIDEHHIEGMVSTRSLRDDYYVFDEKLFQLVGQHSGRRYQLGDAVRIKVKRANLEQKQLDYALIVEKKA